MTNVVLPVGGNGPLGQALQKALSEQFDVYIVVATLDSSMSPPQQGPIVFTRLSAQVYLQQVRTYTQST
jgi:5'(3')-deoxyribonucleotidase